MKATQKFNGEEYKLILNSLELEKARLRARKNEIINILYPLAKMTEYGKKKHNYQIFESMLEYYEKEQLKIDNLIEKIRA